MTVFSRRKRAIISRADEAIKARILLELSGSPGSAELRVLGLRYQLIVFPQSGVWWNLYIYEGGNNQVLRLEVREGRVYSLLGPWRLRAGDLEMLEQLIPRLTPTGT